MPLFVRLVKITSEGMKHVKELPERYARGRDYLESLGGRSSTPKRSRVLTISSQSSKRPTNRW